MRVITGKARGRRLETLTGEDVRPTADRIKEAIFSALQFEIEGRLFLDLFAGTGLMENASVMNMDFIGFLKMKSGKFDIAFLDPPYRTGLLQKALELVVGSVKKTGVIVCESPLDEELPENCGDFTVDRTYRYGKIKVTMYRHKDMLTEE